MIYALVEPSIYMIASILPTTRHLYRRLRSKARLTAQMRSDKSDSAPGNHGSSRSADVERIQSRETVGGQWREEEVWEGLNRHSSQEELTLNPLGGQRGDKPRGLVRTRIEMRDRAVD